MPLSLHAAFVPTASQIVTATRGLVDKAEGWCNDTGTDARLILGCRLIEDMLAFDSQVKSVAVHTRGAIEGVRAGVFRPDVTPPPEDFAGLSAQIAAARETLTALDEAEMEGWTGQPMRFEFRDYRMDFSAEDFLLSFSQPNYFFHAATAYDILRMKGVKLGKRDFVGPLRLAQG